jgi:hypothetical protein
VDARISTGQAFRVDSERDFMDRLAEGRALASSLVGLGRDAAVERAAERGFRTQAVSSSATVVTTELAPNRIRLFVDADGVVVRARAG